MKQALWGGHVLQHVAASDEIKIMGDTLVERSQRRHTVSHFDSRDVVYAGHGLWKEAFEKIAPITTEIKNCLNTGRHMIAEDFSEGCTRPGHRSGGESVME